MNKKLGKRFKRLGKGEPEQSSSFRMNARQLASHLHVYISVGTLKAWTLTVLIVKILSLGVFRVE